MNPFYPKENPAKGTTAPLSFSRKINSRLLHLCSFFFLLLSFQWCQAQITQITEADIPMDFVSPFPKTISGQVFTFSPAANSSVFEIYANDIGTEGFGGLYAYDGSTNDGTEFSLSAPAGYSFDFNSFRYVSDRGPVHLDITITFTNNTTDVKSYTLTGDNTVKTFNSFTTAANDIKKIRFVADALVYYNDFSVTDVKSLPAMPVTWMSFTAASQANKVTLNWSTAVEQNAKEFIVQHSTDGRNWKAVGTVAATGTSSTIQAYSFVHSNLVNGANYYRLLQRDLDGRENYSKIIKADIYGSTKQLIVYPNPANGIVTIRLQQPSNVQVYNNLGLLVVQKQLAAGMHSLELGQFAKGVYVVKANNEALLIHVQ